MFGVLGVVRISCGVTMMFSAKWCLASTVTLVLAKPRSYSPGFNTMITR